MLFGGGSDGFGFCWPGIRPGRRVTFIWRQMKVTKAKAPLLPASLRFAPGNLRCSVVGCTAKLVARYALHSNRRGESVHVAVAFFDATAQPTPCAPRRMQKGWGPEYRDSFLER